MNVIVTLTGPSCSGKSTLQKLLVAEHGFAEIVSHTSRIKRNGEVDGEDYHFVSKTGFRRLKEASEFVESVEFNGNGYAVSESEIRKAFAADKPVVVVVEPNGAEQIAAWSADADVRHVSVYVGNPIDLLLQRMVKRIQSDTAAHPAIYAQRLRSLIEKELGWRWKINWTLAVNEFDSGPTQEQLIVAIKRLVNPKPTARKGVMRKAA